MGDVDPAEHFEQIDRWAFSNDYVGDHRTALRRRGLVVRCDAEGALVGYVRAIGISGYDDDNTVPWIIDTIAVVRPRQGEGIGTVLLAEMGSWLSERGVVEATTTALHGEDRDRRVRWFQANGFAYNGGHRLTAKTEILAIAARSASNGADGPRHD